MILSDSNSTQLILSEGPSPGGGGGGGGGVSRIHLLLEIILFNIFKIILKFWTTLGCTFTRGPNPLFKCLVTALERAANFLL